MFLKRLETVRGLCVFVFLPPAYRIQEYQPGGQWCPLFEQALDALERDQQAPLMAVSRCFSASFYREHPDGRLSGVYHQDRAWLIDISKPEKDCLLLEVHYRHAIKHVFLLPPLPERDMGKLEHDIFTKDFLKHLY